MGVRPDGERRTERYSRPKGGRARSFVMYGFGHRAAASDRNADQVVLSSNCHPVLSSSSADERSRLSVPSVQAVTVPGGDKRMPSMRSMQRAGALPRSCLDSVSMMT
jgi:hypothetical protein